MQFKVYSREHLSWKTSLVDNLRDVLNRQHMAGDPGVRLYDEQPHCTRCHSADHYTISCPLKTATVGRSDDAKVDSFLLSDKEEILEYQKLFMSKVIKGWNL